jgi:hypothetical protein
MDFITELPTNAQTGGTSVLVVVDRFSKQTHLVPLAEDTTSSTLAQNYLNSIVKLHGMPKSIRVTETHASWRVSGQNFTVC